MTSENFREYCHRNKWLTIDWQRINRALDYYKISGFQYVEVPWLVEPEDVAVTYPKNLSANHKFQTNLGSIVGSAEQSFISLMRANIINKNDKVRLVAVTPCFRDNQPIDIFHLNYFMKVELFSTDPNYKANSLMQTAGQFFTREGANLSIVETEIGLDWFIDDVEIGSYGNRKFGDNLWSYGTGLAEPRFSQALDFQKLPNEDEKLQKLKFLLEDLTRQ